MSQVGDKDTAPERIVRTELHKMGYRFRLHVANLPGSPDIVLPRHGKLIMVHGCFWHGHKGCSRSKRPTSNVKFWNKKINGNMERDRRILRKLRLLGWRVLAVWQCQTRDVEALQKRLAKFMLS